jgi:hypothetical protein
MMGERFLSRLLRGTLPLIVWGLHFALCYALVAAQCTAQAPSRSLLALVSVLALGACAALLWRARGTLAGISEQTGLLDWAAAGSAVLALAGIMWASVPVLLLD